jgi:hypothetical protein
MSSSLKATTFATAQFAVDGEIEQRQVALAICQLKLGADRPDVLWPQWRLGSGQLALVPSGTLGTAEARFSLSCMVILLICENDQHGLNTSALDRRATSASWGEPAAPAMLSGR